MAFGFGLPAIFGKGIAASTQFKVVAGGAIVAAAAAFVLLALGVLLGNGDASLGKIAFVRDGNIWVQELPDGVPYQLTDKGGPSRRRVGRRPAMAALVHRQPSGQPFGDVVRDPRRWDRRAPNRRRESPVA